MKKVYRSIIEVLTPVHIGVFDFEIFSFFEKDGYLYLVDWNKVFKDGLLFEELKKVLNKEFANDEEWFLYFENEFIKKNKEIILEKNFTQLRIKINKNVNKEITSLRRNLKFNIRYFNFEKNKYLPYIPGTSLKGVLANIFNFNQIQAKNIFVSDFYLENEDKEATEIFLAQRYYIDNLFPKDKSANNFVEMFVPGTKLVGEIKIAEEINFFTNNLKPYYYLTKKNFKYFSLLPNEIKENLDNLLKNGHIPVLLGFGVGKDEAKTKYLVSFDDKKTPLGLTVLTLEEKNE